MDPSDVNKTRTRLLVDVTEPGTPLQPEPVSNGDEPEVGPLCIVTMSQQVSVQRSKKSMVTFYNEKWLYKIEIIWLKFTSLYLYLSKVVNTHFCQISKATIQDKIL